MGAICAKCKLLLGEMGGGSREGWAGREEEGEMERKEQDVEGQKEVSS